MQAQHLVRASDPLSSVLAAERAIKFAGNHCDRILAALKAAGQATPHELEDITGLTVVQIDRRLPDLKKAGKAQVVQRGGMDHSVIKIHTATSLCRKGGGSALFSVRKRLTAFKRHDCTSVGTDKFK